VQPQTRKERLSQQYREDLEKLRLQQRREGYCTYQARGPYPCPGYPAPRRAHAPARAAARRCCMPAAGERGVLSLCAQPDARALQEAGLTPTPGSLGYISEAERFITDTAGVAKVERDAEIAKKEQILYNKRTNSALREEKRWRTIEIEEQMDQKRQEDEREHSTYSRSNKTSMPYNPINLEYCAGRDGECLRYSDEALNYRISVRAEHLQRRNNGGYDPITGEAMQRVQVPNPPKAPSFMLG